jgi:hypothetical protein
LLSELFLEFLLFSLKVEYFFATGVDKGASIWGGFLAPTTHQNQRNQPSGPIRSPKVFGKNFYPFWIFDLDY